MQASILKKVHFLGRIVANVGFILCAVQLFIQIYLVR